MVRRETQMVEKCCGSKWLVSIATGGHSDMTTSNGVESSNVFLPVIAVDSPHARKCAPITAIRLVLTVFGQEYEQQHRDGAPGRTLPGLLSPSGSAHGLIIVVTGPVFHPTTWLPE